MRPYVLQAAVSLARLNGWYLGSQAIQRSDVGGIGSPRIGPRLAPERAAASRTRHERRIREALTGLGASLKSRGVDPLDVTSALRDVVQLVVRLAATPPGGRALAIERRAIQWGIEGYNGTGRRYCGILIPKVEGLDENHRLQFLPGPRTPDPRLCRSHSTHRGSVRQRLSRSRRPTD